MNTRCNDIFAKAKSLFHRSRKEVIKTTAIGRTMIEESQLETKKRNLIKELGELTFQLYTKGEIQNKKVEAFCRKINLLHAKINEKESVIDKIKSGKEKSPRP